MEDGDCPVTVFLEWYMDGSMVVCSFPRFGAVAGSADGGFAKESAIVHFPG